MRSIWFTLFLTPITTALIGFLAPSPSLGQPNPTECIFPVDEPILSQVPGWPTVSHRQDGGFLVAYSVFMRTANPDGEFERAIFLRRFDAVGNYVGPPSVPLPFEPFGVQGVDLERDTDGHFILGWSSNDLDGPDTHV